jgi:hypothetical protein
MFCSSQNGVLLTMNRDSKLEPPRWRPGPAEEAFTRRERYTKGEISSHISTSPMSPSGLNIAAQ